ncbi:MAG: hypothetical protein R2710_10730 [Acidimicrobiales bacterium]
MDRTTVNGLGLAYEVIGERGRPWIITPGGRFSKDYGGKMPSEVFRDHILACYITDPSGLLLRDRIGIDNIAWECDYPTPTPPGRTHRSSRGANCKTPVAATTRSTRSPGRTPAGSSTGTPSNTPLAKTPPSGRFGRADAAGVDVTRMPKAQWRERNEAAGIGVF